jgi:hypothetical protein
MRPINIKTQIRVVGALAIVLVLVSIWMGRMNSEQLPGGFKSPVLAMELPKSGADIDAINRADDGKARAFVLQHLSKDVAFLFSYTLLFTGLGLVLSQLSATSARWIGLIAVVLAVLAGVFDFIENSKMLEAVGTTPGTATDALANSIRCWSLTKWSTLYLYSFSIGLILFTRSGWLLTIGLFFLATAVIGLTGVIFNVIEPKFYWMFPRSTLSLGLATLIIAIQFTLAPSEVLDQFPSYPREFFELQTKPE